MCVCVCVCTSWAFFMHVISACSMEVILKLNDTSVLSIPLGTTRPMQEGEMNGVDYDFISVDKFKQKEKAGELLESGMFEGNYYGTPRPPADPSSGPNHMAYSRSPASAGYSKEGVIASGPAPGGRGPIGGPPPSMPVPKNLGPLPANWEIAYTENNEKYFIE